MTEEKRKKRSMAELLELAQSKVKNLENRLVLIKIREILKDGELEPAERVSKVIELIQPKIEEIETQTEEE